VRYVTRLNIITYIVCMAVSWHCNAISM